MVGFARIVMKMLGPAEAVRGLAETEARAGGA